MVADDPFNNVSWNGPRHVRYGGLPHGELVDDEDIRTKPSRHFEFDCDFQSP